MLDIKINNMAYKIAFFGAKPYDIASFDKVNEKYNYDIRYYKGHLNPNNVVLTQDTDVVCIFVNDTADAAVIDAMVDNGVKLLALRCAGFNNVDLKAAKGKLPVVRVPAYSPYAVAEYSLALMLSLNRKIHRAYWRTRDGNFSLNGLMGFDMHGKTVGIIGTGKIAKILIRILKGLGMHILAYDVYPDYKFAEEEGITYTTLDELYKAAVTSNLESYRHEGNVDEKLAAVTESKTTETENKQENTKENESESEKGMIFPNSSEVEIASEDIKKLSDEDLRYAVNEIYARHGYIFKDDQLRTYYEQYDWYKETIKPEDFSDSVFNDVEKRNVQALQKERDARSN